MKFEFSELINEAVKLELNISELYLVFHSTFHEDSGFWWKLAIEEKNHASLLKNLEDFATQLSAMPSYFDKVSIGDLEGSNNDIEKLIQQFEDSPPGREEAFQLAYKLEWSAGESHFQDFTDDESGSQISRIFKHLNQSDRDHAERIKEYAEAHGMQVQTS
ncbi:MAG: rubrerythrin family protein [Chlorobi bacterium]|nr:rubrerythrin family protein [Chlorobiota bacterium]